MNFDEAILNGEGVQCGGSYISELKVCRVGQVDPGERRISDNQNFWLGRNLAYPADFRDGDPATKEEIKDTKKFVVGGISKKTGLEEEFVKEQISGWAESANGEECVKAQIASTAEFGCHLSAWQKSDEGKEADAVDISEERYLKSPNGQRMRKFLRAMYDVTQKDLKDLKQKDLILYRGVTTPGHSNKDGDTVKVESNAIESWTCSEEIAQKFATEGWHSNEGFVLKAKIPVDQILSTARTGYGCLNEREFTVLNNKPIKAVVLKSDY